MPSRWQVRMIRAAISPRLAISRRRMITPRAPALTSTRDEDGAAANASLDEVGERLRTGLKVVHPRVHLRPALLGQSHQLDEVVVAADEVADEAALGTDEVHRGH